MILASDSGILEVQIHSENSDPKMGGVTCRVIGLLEASKHRHFYSQVFHSQGLGNRFVGRHRWNLLHVTVTAVAARGFSKRSLLSVTRRHLLEMTQITEPWKKGKKSLPKPFGLRFFCSLVTKYTVCCRGLIQELWMWSTTSQRRFQFSRLLPGQGASIGQLPYIEIHCAGGSLESTKRTKGHNLPGTSLWSYAEIVPFCPWKNRETSKPPAGGRVRHSRFFSEDGSVLSHGIQGGVAGILSIQIAQIDPMTDFKQWYPS